ncbi:MAG: Uma2 family endonuclease [Sarcina sp.]
MTLLNNNKFISLLEFDNFIRDKENRFELIDNEIYQMSCLNALHQSISSNLLFELKKYFTKLYRVIANLNIILKQDDNVNVVIPDISVICNTNFDLLSERYEGSPILIVEIVSFENVSNDTVRKLNLYAKSGIKEYWIINPIDKNMIVYSLNNSNRYLVYSAITEGNIKSKLFEDLVINFDELFL